MKNRQVTVSKDALEDMRTRLAEAERHREVLADALRVISYGGCCETPGCTEEDPKCDARTARAALRECGLLRPQDDPDMIPAAWLPGAEEEER